MTWLSANTNGLDCTTKSRFCFLIIIMYRAEIDLKTSSCRTLLCSIFYVSLHNGSNPVDLQKNSMQM